MYGEWHVPVARENHSLKPIKVKTTVFASLYNFCQLGMRITDAWILKY
jgi:hypothetical protein